MHTYLKQTDPRSKQEVIKVALEYFWQLINNKQPRDQARDIVRRKTGVII